METSGRDRATQPWTLWHSLIHIAMLAAMYVAGACAVAAGAAAGAGTGYLADHAAAEHEEHEHK
jgi:hypothetical protein